MSTFTTLLLQILFAAASPPSDSITVSVRAAGHHGSVAGHRLTWQSYVAVSMDAPPSNAQSLYLPLARALPADTRITYKEQELDVVRDDRDGVVGVVFAPRHLLNGVLHLHSQQDMPNSDPAQILPPIPAGSFVQRITLDGANGLVFEPDPESVIRKHVGYWAQSGISDRERHLCNDFMDQARHRFLSQTVVVDHPIYLRGDLVSRDGLVGTFTSQDHQRKKAMLVGVVALPILLALLFLAQRHLARQARYDQAEKLVDAEFNGLGDRP